MNVNHSTKPTFVPARRNPFAVEHVTKIPFRFEQGNWSSNLKRLSDLSYRAAIVGPKGSGKTTLLSELEGRIKQETDHDSILVLFPLEKETHSELLTTVLAESANGKVVLVDGIERITVRQKFRLFRETYHQSGLIVAAHHVFRLPPFNLPTWVRTASSEFLLDYVLSELKMASPEVRAAGQEALGKRRGNVRDVLRDLYDRHASLRFKQ